PSSSLATESVTMDGVWWQQLSDEAKLYAVQSMVDSYQIGYLQGSATVLKKILFSKIGSTSGGMKAVADAMKSNRVPEFSKTFGTYVDQINDFYASNPAKAGIRVGLVIGCLSDHPVVQCSDLKVPSE